MGRCQRKLLIATLSALQCVARQPIPEDRGAVALAQQLRRLQTTARVMTFTAHPDDEDSGTITWLSRGYGAEVTMLVLNRGESGANLVSSDFFDALGMLRTAELRKAAEHYGARLRFTRFIDYGFSKNVEETFRNWNREDLLRDVVRIVRRERPHILVSRFQGTVRDGHGNHQAAGLMALAAFEAAGDPKRFPELAGEGLAPWQPLKLYTGGWRENEAWTVAVDSGIYDPVLGRSYAQLGRDGYRYHRSQGMSLAMGRPGPQIAYYKLQGSQVGDAVKEASLLERTNFGLAKYVELAREVESAAQAFAIDRPEACVAPLANALRIAAGLRRAAPGDYDLEIKQRQIMRALTLATGAELDAMVEPANAPTSPFAMMRAVETFALAVPGQTFRVAVTPSVRGRAAAEVLEIGLQAPPGWTVRELGKGRFEVTVAANAASSRAYWTRPSVRATSYALTEPALFSQPLTPPPLQARVRLRTGGVEWTVMESVETSSADSVSGQQRRALASGPVVSVRFATEAGILPVDQARYTAAVSVRNNQSGKTLGTVTLDLPGGWRSEPAGAPFQFEKEGEEWSTVFHVIPAAGTQPGEYPVTARAMVEDRAHTDTFLPITQPGLETVYFQKPARHAVRVVDVKVASGLRVGYVAGTGDDVPEGIRQLGVPVDMLDTTQLAAGDLSRYPVIMLGIRAYAARKDVRVHNARLLDYAERGGVLIVQYNTQEYDHNYGPFPYTMGMRAEEVSEEDSPVEILDPADSVFTAPNRITSRDFEGWVEQRGSKFWTTWDERYKPLLATNDRGQAPQRGGWLTARHGKGLYVYCAYAWYRQLPYGVPGAARLFANLLSLGAADAGWRKQGGRSGAR